MLLWGGCFCRPAAATWCPTTPALRRNDDSLRRGPSCLANDGASLPPDRVEYDPAMEMISISEAAPISRRMSVLKGKLRSWFGPNGQYVRELPCPGCRGRGYTPCAECGIEQSRSGCSACDGKGIGTCRQCNGECVIWEEFIDELPWEKARKSSPLSVKEDDAVDRLDIKLDTLRRAKRVYGPLPPETRSKISKSLRMLNAKTGLFSNHMRMQHRDPKLRARRAVAIKKAKGTATARKRASETQKLFFSDPENRRKRSMAMRGVKFHCRGCGREGHRSFYCPAVKETSIRVQFRCRLCGELGHNRRTCLGRRKTQNADVAGGRRMYSCGHCGRMGHNRRRCPDLVLFSGEKMSLVVSGRRKTAGGAYSCKLCRERGHNRRTCPKRVDAGD